MARDLLHFWVVGRDLVAGLCVVLSKPAGGAQERQSSRAGADPGAQSGWQHQAVDYDASVCAVEADLRLSEHVVHLARLLLFLFRY